MGDRKRVFKYTYQVDVPAHVETCARLVCENRFIRERADHRYCSTNCRIAEWARGERKRKREEKEAHSKNDDVRQRKAQARRDAANRRAREYYAKKKRAMYGGNGGEVSGSAR